MEQEKILTFPVEISARHLHLSKADFETLFGKNYALTPAKNLSQPGEFLAAERLELMTEKKNIKNVAIVGPLREETQVELSLTDARVLGLTPPLRDSGDLKDSDLKPPASLRLINPANPKLNLSLKNGVIVPRRHLHLSPETAKDLNLTSGDSVSVEIKSSLRPLIFKDVSVRVKKDFHDALHLDTDEGNAAGITPDSYAIISN